MVESSDQILTANPYVGKRVVVGVAGGIAAYKSALLVRLLIKAGADVQVVMSRAAMEFVGATTFQALSGRAVFSDLWNLEEEAEIGHIAAADGADLIILAPATANLIARVAAGRASDALSAVVLATRAPVLVAPSMNVNMWQHEATRRNVEALIERGYATVGPGVGFLACRWEGAGRLAEPPEILEAGAHLLSPSDLAGTRIVVTAGPTREPLDPVRFLSNRSTGKMGYAVARAAARRGAVVDLISGPVSLEAPAGVNLVAVTTALEMRRAAMAAATGADAVVMVAAVADLRPTTIEAQKIKKAGLSASPNLELTRNPDILAELGATRAEGSRPVLVGFAAETEDVIERAQAKLVAKGIDMIVANDVSAEGAGFGGDDNRVIFVDGQREKDAISASKDEIAHQLLTRVRRFLNREPSDRKVKVAR